MPIESFGNINDLDPDNPLVDDPVSEGDDHLRGIKQSLQGNVSGDDTFTALLVGGFAAALVDALAFTVKGAPVIDLDQSALDVDTTIFLRNLIGGLSLKVDAGTGRIVLDQTSSAGVFQKRLISILRDDSITLTHPGTEQNSLRTTDRAVVNSSAEVFDSAGQAKPVGFNVLPRVDYVADHTVTAELDSGMKLRVNSSPVALTFPGTLPTDFTCVVINTAIGVNTLVASGGTMRLQGGAGSSDGTISMAGGSVATVSKAGTSTVFEVWGNGVSN